MSLHCHTIIQYMLVVSFVGASLWNKSSLIPDPKPHRIPDISKHECKIVVSLVSLLLRGAAMQCNQFSTTTVHTSQC
jgi:hypothetical protein